MRKTRKSGGIPLKKLATLAALLSKRSMASTDTRQNPVLNIRDRMEITKRDVPMGNEKGEVDIFITEIPSPRRIYTIPDHVDVMKTDVPMGNEKNGEIDYSVSELPSPRRRRRSEKRKKNGKKSRSRSKSRRSK